MLRQGIDIIKKLYIFLRMFLPTAKLCSILHRAGSAMTIRESIQNELRRRGWSHYRLAKKLEGKMPARTVYAYLSGECDLVSERVSKMLEVLGLMITPKPNVKRGKRRPRKEK